MKLTLEEFEKISGDFTESQNDERDVERYCTERDMAYTVMANLRSFLFQGEIDKEARRLQYLALKEEFDPERKTKRLSDCYVTPDVTPAGEP